MLDALPSWVRTLFTVAWVVLGTWAAGHAIMYKRDPKGAALWIFIHYTFPIIGPWFYWAFGINRVESRAKRRLAYAGAPYRRADRPGAVPAHHVNPPECGHLTPLCTIADRITHFRTVAGNTVEPLHNGEQAYPAMWEAIDSARRSITMASYIFDWDEVGRRFVDALGRAARRGVHVHLLLDGIGAVKSFSRIGRALIKAGAELKPYFPLRFPFGRLRLNMRYHGKLLMTDGRVGFTGGINISQRHMMESGSPVRVEDVHFRLTGPIVAQMQHAFCEEWVLAAGRTLTGEDYFPPLERTGPAWCRAIVSGPDEDLEKIYYVVLAGLSAAQQSVRIVTPYFIPSSAFMFEMAMAALRGVAVTVVLPARPDIGFMRWAADAYLWQILERGVTVVRRPPPFIHAKLMIVDDRWVLLGSANLDRRSFRLNFEFNVEAWDSALAARLGTWLDGVVERSERVTLEAIDARPGWKRLRDGTFKLFSPYL